MCGVGFEPTKLALTGLKSVPLDHSGIRTCSTYYYIVIILKSIYAYIFSNMVHLQFRDKKIEV